MIAQVAGMHLGSSCASCAGPLAARQPAQSFKQGLTVFRNIAQYHAFELLEELVEWLLELPTAGL